MHRDDGIVVSPGRGWETTLMETVAVPPEVRVRLGREGSEGLVRMLATHHAYATDRFDRRLGEEIAALRLDVRLESERFRTDLERVRADLIKWNLVFWLGQFAAITAVLSFLLNGR